MLISLLAFSFIKIFRIRYTYYCTESGLFTTDVLGTITLLGFIHSNAVARIEVDFFVTMCDCLLALIYDLCGCDIILRPRD